MSKLNRSFDDAFRKNGRGIPVEFLRALAAHESSFRPSLESNRSSAVGLLQITNVVREAYNKKKGSGFVQSDLLDVSLNVKMATFQLLNIIKSYGKNHPRTLGKDFTSKRWVEILVAGWNMGHSEAAGVGYVVGVLEEQGYSVPQINIVQLHETALSLPENKGKFVKIAARVGFAQKVTDAYFTEMGIRGGLV